MLKLIQYCRQLNFDHLKMLIFSYLKFISKLVISNIKNVVLALKWSGIFFEEKKCQILLKRQFLLSILTHIPD